jgi:hypothetical protein
MNYSIILRALFIFLSILLFPFFASSLDSFFSPDSLPEGFKIITSGKLVKANKLIMVIEIQIPDDWKLRVDDGYESIFGEGVDTVSMSVRFEKKKSYRLIQRLKADRKPSEKGFYYKNITFAQTIAIDTSKLPIKIDANLRWQATDLKEKKFARDINCCLLKVEAKRADVETVNVGWQCSKRFKVYLEDVD